MKEKEPLMFGDFVEKNGFWIPKDVKILAYFQYKKDAEDFVDRLDTPGSMSSFHVNEPLRVYQDIEDYNENNPESLRQKTLSKLTEEEKEALGIRE